MFSAASPTVAAENMANAIFLVARRGMTDPNFSETVVLVTQPPSGRPTGVIINRPLDELLSNVFPDQPSLKGRKDVLHFGGPVAPQGLVFLVRSARPPEGAMRLLRDVFITSDIELIEALFKRKNPLNGLRVYAGYAGWGPDQLHKEIARGSWHAVPADAATVFEKDPASIWPELIERVTTRQTMADGGWRMADGAGVPMLSGARHTPLVTRSHLKNPLTLALSQVERVFSPFSPREKGGDEGPADSEVVLEVASSHALPANGVRR